MAKIKFAKLRLTASGYSIDVIAEGYSTIGAVSLKIPHANFVALKSVKGAQPATRKGMLVYNDTEHLFSLGWIMPAGKTPASNGKLFTLVFTIANNPFTFLEKDCEIADQAAIPYVTEYVSDLGLAPTNRIKTMGSEV